ncbi:MAG: signal peptidase I [Robiginitomaculum sp.]|nr:signal peptidase I [Robiginitomaculum sp.]
MIETQKQKKLGFIVETIKTVAIALSIAFLLRTFLFQPFHIPSSSMEPTLYKGDYIITTKYSLGYGKYAASPLSLPIKKGRVFERIPKRGDVIVFKPIGSSLYFIKRLAGLPGDELQMKGGFLYINGVRQRTTEISVTTQTDQVGNPFKFRQYKEFFDNNDKPHMTIDKQVGSEVDSTGVYNVPAGNYFFMGDNRDRSLDSRYPTRVGGVGYVPASHLVGRAEFILLSVEDGFSIKKPWTWGKLRGDRFFKGLR